MLCFSCESFRLSPPFKAKFSTLSIQTVRGGLENLVKLIRKNILQTPKSTWVDKVQRNQSTTPTATQDNVETSKQTSITEQSRRASTSSKFAKKDFIAKNKEALAKVKKLEYDNETGAVASNTRRRSSGEERVIRSTSLFENDFKPNRRKSENERLAAIHTCEDSPLNPEMLAEMIR